MENIVTLLIPVLLGIALIRMLLLPLKLVVKLLLHSGGGFLCLWLLNTVSGLTGIFLPVNLVTVFIAGFLGIPGIGLISYTIMKIFGGKAKEVSVLTYVISALFLVKFFLAV